MAEYSYEGGLPLRGLQGWVLFLMPKRLKRYYGRKDLHFLVQHPRDWPWSSFSFYANDEPGLIRIDAVD